MLVAGDESVHMIGWQWSCQTAVVLMIHPMCTSVTCGLLPDTSSFNWIDLGFVLLVPKHRNLNRNHQFLIIVLASQFWQCVLVINCRNTAAIDRLRLRFFYRSLFSREYWLILCPLALNITCVIINEDSSGQFILGPILLNHLLACTYIKKICPMEWVMDRAKMM